MTSERSLVAILFSWIAWAFVILTWPWQRAVQNAAFDGYSRSSLSERRKELYGWQRNVEMFIERNTFEYERQAWQEHRWTILLAPWTIEDPEELTKYFMILALKEEQEKENG